MATLKNERQQALDALKEEMAEAQNSYGKLLNILDSAIGGDTEAMLVMRKNKKENCKRLINSFSKMSRGNFALLVRDYPEKAIEVLKLQTRDFNSFLNNAKNCISNAVDTSVKEDFNQMQNFLKNATETLNNYVVSSKNNAEIANYAVWLSTKINELKDLYSENLTEENRVKQNYKVIVDEKDRIPVYDRRRPEIIALSNTNAMVTGTAKAGNSEPASVSNSYTETSVENNAPTIDEIEGLKAENARLLEEQAKKAEELAEAQAKNEELQKTVDEKDSNAYIISTNLKKSNDEIERLTNQNAALIEEQQQKANELNDALARIEEAQNRNRLLNDEIASMYQKQDKDKKKRLGVAIVAGILILGTIIGSGFLGKHVGKKSADAQLEGKDLIIAEFDKDLAAALEQIKTLSQSNKEILNTYEDFRAWTKQNELNNQSVIAEWQQKFNDEVEKRQAAQEQYDKLVSDYAQLQKDYENALNNNDSALIASLRSRIAAQSNEIISLNNKIAEKDRELTNSINDYKTLESKYNDLKEQLENHECEYPTELIAQLKSQVSEAEQKAADAENRAQQAEADRQASEAEKLKAQQEAEQAREELANAKAELEDARKTIQELNDIISSLNNQNNYGGEVSNEGANNQGGATQVTDSDKNNDNSSENEDSGHVSGGVDRNPHDSDDLTRE